MAARAEQLGLTDEGAAKELGRIAIDVLKLHERLPRVHPERKKLQGEERLKTAEERAVDFTKTREGFRYWTVRQRRPGDGVGIDIEMLPAIAIFMGWTLERTLIAYMDEMFRHSGGIDEVEEIVNSYAETATGAWDSRDQIEVERILDSVHQQVLQAMAALESARSPLPQPPAEAVASSA